MAAKYVFSIRAIEESNAAYNWYFDISKKLADRFILELETTIGQVTERPLSFRKVHKEFRQSKLRSFPCLVVFEVIEGVVIVQTIFHTSRNPKKKFRK